MKKKADSPAAPPEPPRRVLERAQLSLARAQLSVTLWSLPLLSNSDAPLALDISQSNWEILKARGEGPPMFDIGGRVFVSTKALRDWLEYRASEARPGPRKRGE